MTFRLLHMSDKPALRPGLAVGEALRAVARDILADARSAIENPAHSDATAVHDFRRAMKRWRSFLRLLGPFLGEEGRRLRAQARDLARALGGARDAQAALDALADLVKRGLDLPERSLATLRARIDAIRQSAEATILTADMRGRLTGALDDAGTQVETWPLHVLTFADIAERLAGAFGAARRARPASWSAPDSDALHELRKRVVDHRYQMETVKPLWPRFGRMWIAETQRLRERLGRHQDLLVLARLTEPHQPLARWRSRLMPSIERRKAEHTAAARRLAARLFVEKPRAFRRRLDVMWETGE
jgi:CHAD domain-containing protein